MHLTNLHVLLSKKDNDDHQTSVENVNAILFLDHR